MTPKLTTLLLLVLAILSGCASEEARRRELGKQTDELYAAYLDGGRDEARRSIVQANRLVEEASISHFEENRAFALFLGYGRLYALDHRAGNNELAELDLIKARYWALRSSEAHGDTPTEVAKYVDRFATSDRLLEFIDTWERKANHGREPKYIQHP